MSNFKFKLLSLMFSIMVSTCVVFADGIQIGGLYYKLDAANNTAEVTYQSYVSYKYNEDWYITTAVIPPSVTNNGTTYEVTSIGQNAFNNCGSLSSVELPNSLVTINNGAFSECGSLNVINIPNSVTTIGNAFYNCSSLTSVTIGNSVSSISTSALETCPNLTTIIVDEGNAKYDSRNNCNAIINTSTNTLIIGCSGTTIPNSVVAIGQNAFENCSSLQSITIPTSVITIGERAFGDCISLTSIEIPNSVETIANSAFIYCYGLSSVTIGNGIKTIGSAFEGCTNLSSFICKATTPPSLDNDAFLDVDKSIPIYVPAQSVSLYQNTEGWSDFSNIQAIPSSGGTTPFPDDPGTLTLKLEISAYVIDGDSIAGQAPAGGGGYPEGTELTITARDIPGYEFVRWSDEVTDKSRTIILNESITLIAYYTRSMIEIAVAANQWTFISLPPLGDRQYLEDMFTYDGLSDVQWGTYNGSKRAAGKSGWETPKSFRALQGYIIYSTTAGTLRINAYQDEIQQGESGSDISVTLSTYSSAHAENESWNFLGNPYSQGFNISVFADSGIESPITVWNGTGYTTYTPGIDEYILQPFEAFFIQKSEENSETIRFIR